jgi:hypothetical protein
MTTTRPQHPHIDQLSTAPGLEPNVAHTVYVAVRSVRHAVDRNGSGYFDLIVADASATFPAKVWRDARSYTEITQTQLAEGMVAKLLVTVGSYRDTVQLNVLRARPVSEDDEWVPDAIWGPGWEQVEGLRRKTLVFDIETVPGIDLGAVPDAVAKAVARQAERNDGDTDKTMGLSPYFGKVVSLAFCEGEGDAPADAGDPVTALVVPPPGREHDEYPEWVRPMSEPELLRSFWHLAESAELVVSFNGRGFDVPFLLIRSLIHGIPARVDLLSSPFSLRPHLDQFRLIGSGRGGVGMTSLDVVCWALGIESPKGAMDGSMVGPAYARGEIESIATYNAADVRATAAVFRHLREQLLPFRKDW